MPKLNKQKVRIFSETFETVQQFESPTIKPDMGTVFVKRIQSAISSGRDTSTVWEDSRTESNQSHIGCSKPYSDNYQSHLESLPLELYELHSTLRNLDESYRTDKMLCGKPNLAYLRHLFQLFRNVLKRQGLFYKVLQSTACLEHFKKLLITSTGRLLSYQENAFVSQSEVGKKFCAFKSYQLLLPRSLK